MTIEIKNRYTDVVLHTVNADTLSDANLSYVNLSGANLSYANLRFATLSYANLRDAYLYGATLSGADLSGANLSSATLSDANLSYVNLSSATLSDANLSYVNLSGADLSGANLSYANLRFATLSGVNLSSAKIDGLQIVTAEQGEPLLRQVAEAALSAPGCLSMKTWHACETSHCIAGWAIHLSGDKGRDLEKKYGSANAGMILLGVEASTHFYDDNETARKWLESIK